MSETTVVLAWTEASDKATAPPRILYRIYVATAAGGQDLTAPPTSTVTGVTEATVGGLHPKQAYHFLVRAVDEAGNADANLVERSATPPDMTAPAFTGLGSAVPAGAGSVSLGWEPALDNADASKALRYRAYVAESFSGHDFASPAQQSAPGETAMTLDGLLEGRTYFFAVRAVDSSGNEDGNTIALPATTTDTQPPLFSGALGATPGPSSATLSWNPASDNATATGAIRYLVYQATSSGGQNFGSPTATTAGGATVHSAGGLLPNTTYYFVVRAMDDSGNVDGNTVEVPALTPSGTDTLPPGFAGASAATAESPSRIRLDWTAATDDVSPAAFLTYLVYRAGTPGGQSFASPTYTTLSGATSFAATDLQPSTPYYFVVRARDQAGNVDANTVEVSATTAADSTPPSFGGASSAAALSPGSILLGWGPAIDDVTPASGIQFLIYQAASPGGQSFAAPSYLTAPGAASFVVTGLSPSTTSYFVVRARDGAGNVDTNAVEVGATTGPDVTAPAFSGLLSAMASSPSSIALAWRSATDDVTPSAEIVYLVYRAAAPGAQNFSTPTYTTLPGATSFTAGGLASGTPYYFVARARDAAMNVDASTVERSAETLTTVSFAADVQTIFNGDCSTGCHGSGNPPEGLDLSDAATSHANLVNVLSTECTTTLRVEPRQPDSSYLVHKLEGMGPCFQGEQMPRSGPPLSPAQIDTIRTWIAEGARNN